MIGKLSADRATKKARRTVHAGPIGPWKRKVRRSRRRVEKKAVKEGRFDFLGRGLQGSDVD